MLCQCDYTSSLVEYFVHSYTHHDTHVQDAFQVATLENPAPGNSRFPRGKDRHVFLFDKVIILSTKTQTPEDKKGNKKDVYLYKEHLDVSYIYMYA